MPFDHPAAPAMTSSSPSTWLEIEDHEGSPPVKVPVLIKNLSAGLVSVEVQDPACLAGWKDLENRSCTLCLSGPKRGAPVILKGTVTWKSYNGAGRQFLNLGLALDNSSKAANGGSDRDVAQPPEDIKGLWDRWDHARETMPYSLDKIYLGGLVVMLTGLALQLPGSPFLKFLSYALWFLGSVGVLGTSLWYLWHRRAAR